ncbi:hypothetical protein A2954_04560 [Candidatus Roizmanbacteria bacterium RIFCSPLOWO2_01_FULL_37_12]|uniref:Glycosyltransferase RgtA/B/C/D-like domain-containing protein n=1 Tax=Candidatus Roizmanbacteria bacterium RIFCSPLOWO2_01_FULL_37_12 TaxID=1802056 RepID=A0A1F7IFX1_9BACT|nr:MAG: hypothetical protein A3D76_02505 [Candidatus Roizmanbacteria bacterium RIFCSPHIGHO2_02_FULL_37_9b]OGK42253.1 MAG: hypothetical protein A2954_04560 [Candidatus Roizmanbacteria bacterium RIFCSPLOWO2_01_FULL_37_12]
MHRYKFVEILLAFLFFSLLTFIITYPALLSLNTKIIGDAGDNFQFIGFQYLGNKLFTEGNFPFGWTNNWRYPDGINFQNATDSGIFILLGIFLYPLLINPLTVYNVSILILVCLNLFLTYIAFRTVFSGLIAYTGAVIYGLSFYTLARIGGHPNLILHAGFPLFFISLYLITKEKGSVKSFTIFTLGIVILTVSSLQYPLLLLGSIIFLTPLTYLFFPAKIKEFISVLIAKKSQFILSIIVFSVVTLLLYGHKISLFFSGGVTLPDYKFISIPLVDYFIPNSYIVSLPFIAGNHSKSWIEYAVFLGYVELLLLGAALVYIKKNTGKLFLILGFLIIFILSLGKQPFLAFIWPYQYLIDIFPFRGIIEPGRFFVIFYFFLTLIVMIYLSKFKNHVLLFVILAALLIEKVPTNTHIANVPSDEPFLNSVKFSESNAVLDLPIFTEWWNGHLYDLYYIYHQKPIVNGYIHWSGDKYDPKSLIEELKEYRCHPFPAHNYDEELSHFRKDRSIRLLNYYNIRTLVYHKKLAKEGDCHFVDQYLQTLINSHEDFITLYEDSYTRVLWLKKR